MPLINESDAIVATRAREVHDLAHRHSQLVARLVTWRTQQPNRPTLAAQELDRRRAVCDAIIGPASDSRENHPWRATVGLVAAALASDESLASLRAQVDALTAAVSDRAATTEPEL